MYDLETIKAMNQAQARKAKRTGKRPYVAEKDADEGVFSCPNLGDYRPKGWELVNRYFVDKFGFPQDREMTAHNCLSGSCFLQKVKAGFGYAVIEEGQFQLYIGEFQREKNNK